MCGIAGYLDRQATPDELWSTIGGMTHALAHRGPDDAGYWVDPGHGLALGHRRLAIQDLSPAGHQPMFTADGAWGVVFNGEIYNATALRRRLPASIAWRGHSDTEVLLEGFRQWGIDETIRQCEGMFALAAWEPATGRLTLVRDRLGIKPLYYSLQGERFFWASELKGLMAAPSFVRVPATEPLQRFLEFGYVPGNEAILQRTYKLDPGGMLTVPVANPQRMSKRIYWSAEAAAESARGQALPGTREELVNATGQLVADIVRGHLVADVPVGAFLSGGIDSSLVAATMRNELGSRFSTFSIGFSDPRFDEAPLARRIAKTLGTDHHELYVEPDVVRALVPRWSEFYSEPLSDTSGLPTMLVAQLARQHVSVVLSGDGGDELFAGYRRYEQTIRMADKLRHLPLPARRLLAQLLAIPPRGFYRQLNGMQRWLRRNTGESLPESVRKLRAILAAENDAALYACLSTVSFRANRDLVRTLDSQLAGAISARAHSAATANWSPARSLLDNMQIWDSAVYLPDDILAKVDTATMSIGLEARVPLLDHRLYAWSWSLPGELKRAQGEGKVVLRELLARDFPRDWFARPKRGFSAPMSAWLRGPLREWADGLVTQTPILASGQLCVRTVHRYWQELLSGQAGHARIWPILVYLDWSRHYLHSGPHRPQMSQTDAHRLRNARRHSLSLSG